MRRRRRRIRLTFLLAGAALAAPVELWGQAPGQGPQAPAGPAPRAADVASVDAIIAALYDVISGPAGQPRDWDRMRSLFAPGARLIPTGRRPDGSGSLRAQDVEQFIASSDPVLRLTGFYEREVARRTERFGNIVHAFSTYESRRAPDDARPFARGINSIQLWSDGRRWYVVTIFWEAESPGVTIPPAYLPPAR